MKNTKKILSLMLALLMMISLLAGCGGGTQVAETTPDGSAAQNKTCIVSYNSSGFGHTWLEKAAEAFEEMYAEEGYKLELDISLSNESNAALEIGLGADKNDVDLYIGTGNLETLLDASNKTMRGEGAVLTDLKDLVWNQPAIGAGKVEEDKTIAERYLLDEEFLPYDGALEEFHGGIYALPLSIASCGVFANMSVLEKYGVTAENLPRTTDEFNALCAKIAETSAETGVYAYSWPGANAPGYITYLFFEYFAQYSGKDKFMNFCKTMPESGDVMNDGWMVYEDEGILQGFKAMEPIMKKEFSPAGSVSMTHMQAQHEFLVGNAAFNFNGDWLLNEMEAEYFDEAAQCVMLNTPVLSVIGTECGITDEQLSEAVKLIDEGKTNEEVIAAVSGLDDAGAQRIRDARNIYGCGEASVRGGTSIPAYADAKDVAVLFVRFLCSEAGQQIIRDEAYMFGAFACESYASAGNTPYMDSVVANRNPGQGEYISMDAGLSAVRATSGMLYFNHPKLVQPTTFRSMIMDDTGEYTAENMFAWEKDYAKANWAIWAAYMNK